MEVGEDGVEDVEEDGEVGVDGEEEVGGDPSDSHTLHLFKYSPLISMTCLFSYSNSYSAILSLN